MKALPLWQPWASLVAVGAKRVETRHWPAPPHLVGQRIAIHATKTRDWLHLCREQPFLEFIHGDVPLGAIVATVVLDRCRQITAEGAADLEQDNWREHAFGDYTPGRYAWVLRDVARLAEPVPFRGSQGMFEVPDQLLGLPSAPGHEQGALL